MQLESNIQLPLYIMTETNENNITEDKLTDLLDQVLLESETPKSQEFDFKDKNISDFNITPQPNRENGRETLSHYYNKDFSNLKLHDGNFKNIAFNEVSFSGAMLTLVNFYHCEFNNCDFSNTKSEGCSFTNCNFEKEFSLESAEIVHANIKFNTNNTCLFNLKEATIFNCTLEFLGRFKLEAKKFQVDRSRLIFDELDNRSSLESTFNFIFGKITNSTIHNANFKSINFGSFDFTNTKFIKSTFDTCRFIDAILYGIEACSETKFPSTDFLNAKIDRYSIECIGMDQIARNARVRMKYKDDVATLRYMFSGFNRVIHLVFLFLFLSPYLWFLFKRWGEAKFLPSEPEGTISLFGSLIRFIISGGTTWQVDYHWEILPFIAFCIALTYNLLRLFLLMKTLSLEKQQNISGLPVKFNLEFIWPWKRPFKWNLEVVNNSIVWVIYKLHWLFLAINMIALSYHTWHFMSQSVPVGHG